MSRPTDILALEGRIGYRFNDWKLLATAVTHSSKLISAGGDNQRFEFLGDRVLALLIAEKIMQDDPEAPPGELAVRLNALVSRPSCAKVAEGIGLESSIRVGKSAKRSRDRKGTAILGDAVEAVVAAVYLDGGLEVSRQVVGRLWSDLMAEIPVAARDPKSQLQIWAQARRQTPPDYVLIRRTGPDHEPLFVVEARLQSGETALGKGSSKQRAELDAAQEMLHRLEQKYG